MKQGADRPNIFYRNNESSASIGAGNSEINYEDTPASLNTNKTGIILVIHQLLLMPVIQK